MKWLFSDICKAKYDQKINYANEMSIILQFYGTKLEKKIWGF